METKNVITIVIKAAEGKVLRRISDGWIAGEEIYLGYTVVENWINHFLNCQNITRKWIFRRNSRMKCR